MLSARSTTDSLHMSKTPGWTVNKRGNLQENIVQRGSVTVNHAHSKASTFQPESLQPLRLFKDTPLATKTLKPSTSTSLATRALLDKTPFPNRHTTHNSRSSLKTPIPRSAACSKLLLGPSSSEAEPGSLRPSSTRKSLRAPRTSCGGGSSGGRNTFETPLIKGDPWSVSDTSFEFASTQVVEQEEVVMEEDYDDIEYAPPTAIIPPYKPPFELPDYKALGVALFRAAHTYPADNDSDITLSDYDLNEEEEHTLLLAGGFFTEPGKWHGLELSELEEEDPFLVSHQPKAQPAPAGRPLIKGKAVVSSRLVSRTVVRAPSASGVRPPTRSTFTPTARATAMTTPASALGARVPTRKPSSLTSRPTTALSVAPKRVINTAATSAPSSITRAALKSRAPPNPPVSTLSSRSVMPAFDATTKRTISTTTQKPVGKSSTISRRPPSTISGPARSFATHKPTSLTQKKKKEGVLDDVVLRFDDADYESVFLGGDNEEFKFDV